MYPAIFELCSANHALIALLGSDPFRFYPAGEAPQNVSRPYCVWAVVSGRPENYLSGAPDIDLHVIQVDCYATTLAAARNLASAVRVAVQGRAHVRTLLGEGRDEETDLYAVAFDVEWFENF